MQRLLQKPKTICFFNLVNITYQDVRTLGKPKGTSTEAPKGHPLMKNGSLIFFENGSLFYENGSLVIENGSLFFENGSLFF